MPKPRSFDYGFTVNMCLDGLSCKQIGLLLGVKTSAVRHALHASGVVESDKGRRPYEAWAAKLIAADAEAAAINTQGVEK